MILNNNNNALSGLPFYTDAKWQHWRRDYAFGETPNFIAPKSHLLPFQIVREAHANPVAYVKLRGQDGSQVLDLTAAALANGLRITNYPNGTDTIAYDAEAPLSQMDGLPCGLYYLELSDGAQTWYSELINARADVSDLLLIEFWDNADLDLDGYVVDYADGFKFRLYLPTQVGRPEYGLTEEVVKRDGLVFPERQLAEKTYKFTFLAFEPVLDALRVVFVSDNIVISSLGQTYEAQTFLFDPEWLESGLWASADCEFQTRAVIKKLTRGYAANLGDFNSSFNNSFSG